MLRVLTLYWAARSDQEQLAGRYRKAEWFARKALVTAARCTAPEDPLRAVLWNALGMVRKYRGRYAASARAYAAAERILLADPEPAALASLYHNLGGLEHARGHYARAEVFARRGLALRLAVRGGRHPDVGRDLAALGAILDAQARHGEAEEALRQALAIFRRGWIRPRQDIAAAMSNLAACLERMGRLEEAEETGRRAASLSARVLGLAHPESRIAAENLDVIRASRVAEKNQVG